MAKMKEIATELDDLIYNFKRMSENIDYGDFAVAVSIWFYHIEPVLNTFHNIQSSMRCLNDYHQEFYPEDYFVDDDKYQLIEEGHAIATKQ